MIYFCEEYNFLIKFIKAINKFSKIDSTIFKEDIVKNFQIELSFKIKRKKNK